MRGLSRRKPRSDRRGCQRSSAREEELARASVERKVFDPAEDRKAYRPKHLHQSQPERPAGEHPENGEDHALGDEYPLEIAL